MKSVIRYFQSIFFIICAFLLFSCQNQSVVPFTSSLDSLSNLLIDDSLNISLLTQRANIYIEKNKFHLAKKDIDNAYSVFKNDPDLLLARGSVYYILNQTRISKESWERCLRINPNQLGCREKLTNLFCVVRHPNCKLMIDTLSLMTNGIIPSSFIVFLKEMKEYELAINLLHNRITRFPEEKETLSLLSIIYSDTTSSNNFLDLELADKYFNKIIDLYPNDNRVYYNFGKHKQNLSAYAEALDLYSKSIKLNSSNKQTYYNMGFCEMQLSNYLNAINYFSQAIDLDNSFLLAYHARAYLYNLTNDKDKAKIDWKNCLMLNPSYIPALEALSQ